MIDLIWLAPLFRLLSSISNISGKFYALFAAGHASCCTVWTLRFRRDWKTRAVWSKTSEQDLPHTTLHSEAERPHCSVLPTSRRLALFSSGGNNNSDGSNREAAGAPGRALRNFCGKVRSNGKRWWGSSWLHLRFKSFSSGERRKSRGKRKRKKDGRCATATIFRPPAHPPARLTCRTEFSDMGPCTHYPPAELTFALAYSFYISSTKSLQQQHVDDQQSTLPRPTNRFHETTDDSGSHQI